jgi:hypothetical protein
MTDAAVHPFVAGVLRGSDMTALLPLLSGPRDWEKVLDDSAIHGLTPLLYRRLKGSDVVDRLPGALADRLEQAVFGLAARNMILAEELRDILRAFEDHQMPCAPFRGPALAERLYGDITARPMGDLDFLVRREDLPRVETILQNLGFRQLDRRPGFAQAFSYTLVFVKDRHGWVIAEPHWTISYPPFVATLDMRRVWERCVKGRVVGVDTWVLGREELLLHLCLHLMHPDDGAPLLWFYELDRLLRLDEALIDWPRIVSLAREAELEFLLSAALSRVKEIFGTTPIPGHVLAELARSPRGSGEGRRVRLLTRERCAPGREELAGLLALPGFRAKLRYGLGLLFPAPDFMRIQHGLTGKIQLGSAYVRRFVRVSGQGLKVLTQLLLGPLLPS